MHREDLKRVHHFNRLSVLAEVFSGRDLFVLKNVFIKCQPLNRQHSFNVYVHNIKSSLFI